MVEFTQGTVVYGVRCAKYSLIPCYGIVITARCDIANSKTNKIFKLVGVPVEDWILTNQGYIEVLKGNIKNIKKNLEVILTKYELDLESIVSFTESEIENVLQDSNVSQKDIAQINTFLSKYRQYTSSELTLEQKKSVLVENTSNIQSVMKNIASGKDSHYIILPSDTIEKASDKRVKDLVIDLQEIDYWTFDIVDKLKKNEIDVRSTRLTKNDKTILNDYFYIKEKPGYAEIIGKVTSPWIEFVMQRFTNLFARIGVDTLSESQITELVKSVLN